MRVKEGRSSFRAIERTSKGTPSMIWGSGSETAWIWVVSGFDVKRGSHQHRSQVKGTGHRRGDDHQRDRGSLIGAGEVGVALGVEGGDAGSGSDRDRADF